MNVFYPHRQMRITDPHSALVQPNKAIKTSKLIKMIITLELANLTKLTGVCVVALMISVVGVETT